MRFSAGGRGAVFGVVMSATVTSTFWFCRSTTTTRLCGSDMKKVVPSGSFADATSKYFGKLARSSGVMSRVAASNAVPKSLRAPPPSGFTWQVPQPSTSARRIGSDWNLTRNSGRAHAGCTAPAASVSIQATPIRRSVDESYICIAREFTATEGRRRDPVLPDAAFHRGAAVIR